MPESPPSNDPKVLVEFSPEEIKWLADRLHEMRQNWNAVALFKAQGIQSRGVASDHERELIRQLEDQKKMEATIRNRLVDKASEQGFGDL
jgi:hypothetical protein